MNEMKMKVLLLRGLVTQMPPEDQEKVKEAETRFRAILDETGDVGIIALSLIGADMAEEDE